MFASWQVMSLVADNSDGRAILPADKEATQHGHMAFIHDFSESIAVTMYTGYKLLSSVNVSMQLYFSLSSSHLSSVELILIDHESRTV